MGGDRGCSEQGNAEQSDAKQSVCQPLYGGLFAHADDECANPFETVVTHVIDGNCAGERGVYIRHGAILVERDADIVEYRNRGDIPIGDGLCHKQPDAVIPAFRHGFAHQQGLPGDQSVELGFETANCFPVSDCAVYRNQDRENHQNDRHKAHQVARADGCQANGMHGPVGM